MRMLRVVAIVAGITAFGFATGEGFTNASPSNATCTLQAEWVGNPPLFPPFRFRCGDVFCFYSDECRLIRVDGGGGFKSYACGCGSVHIPDGESRACIAEFLITDHPPGGSWADNVTCTANDCETACVVFVPTEATPGWHNLCNCAPEI